MADKMTTDQVRSKVAWEGVLRATLEYGLHGDEFEDEALGAAWDAARSCYSVSADRWSDDAQAKISDLYALLYR
jgi:hypothetical protein